MPNLENNEVTNLAITIEDIIACTDTTQEDVETIELDCGSMEHPFYENHKRGRNWFAKITGKNAANMERDFLKMRGDIVDLSELKAGDIIEIGSNYTTCGGNVYRNRRYYYIFSINDDEMVYEWFNTPAQALRQKRNILKALS